MPRSPLRPVLLAALLVLSVFTVPPSPASATESALVVHGLKGEYFRMSAPGARDFAEPTGVLLDPNIDLPGLAGTFESLGGRTEHTTARWTGKLTAPATGDYTFYMIGDNGFRFHLDGAPVIEIFQDQQALLDDGVALVALDVGDETDAAGIVFIGRVVQTLGNHA